MLLYQPPFLEVGDLTIFKDDKDPNTFYYAVINPSIQFINGQPSIDAYAIIPDSGIKKGDQEEESDIVEAVLSMEVVLTPQEESLEKIKDEIKKAFKKEVKILAPVPIVEGKVFVSVASIDADNAKEWFVTSGVAPSMIGDNKAALTIKTRGENAKKMLAALNEDTMAGALLYDLRFLGIAPVYKAKMKVKWDKVYKHFEEHKTKNFFFVKEEISQLVDDLKETSVIEIVIEELDPDIKNIAVKNLFNELKSEVLKRLFQPTTPPLSAGKKWEDRIINGVSRLLSSIIPGSHYQLQKVDETQLHETTINLSERRAKKYPFYPQTLLSTLIRNAGGLEEHLKWIKEEDVPFSSEKAVVTLAANTFESENVNSVKIDCRVINKSTNKIVQEDTFVFEKNKSYQRAFRYLREKGNEYDFEYRGVIYMDGNNDEQSLIPSRLEVDWQKNLNEFIYFNTTEYFDSYQLTLALDDISILEESDLVEVNLEVFPKVEKTEGEEGERIPLMQKTLIFNPESKENKTFSFITSRTIPIEVNLDLKYYISGSEEFHQSIKDNKIDPFLIPNPFENKWSIDLISSVDWEDTLKVIAEIRVWDELRKSYILNKFRFTKDKKESTLHINSSMDTPIQVCEYRYSVIKEDASVIRSAWIKHQGPILVVKDNVKAERVLTAHLVEGPDFEEAEIRRLYVQIKYEDKANEVDMTSEKLYFEEIGDEVSFVHPMPDLTKLLYEYRVRATSTSGKRYKTKWTEGVTDNIHVELPMELW